MTLERLTNRIRVTGATERDVRDAALAFARDAHALGPPEVVCRGDEYVLEQMFADIVADSVITVHVSEAVHSAADVSEVISTVARMRGPR